MNNRITQMTGAKLPIIQAPMGWIARAQLASAVCDAGGLGIIETSSGEFDNIQQEIQKLRGLTDKPFGLNIAMAFLRGANVVDFVVEQGINFVTTSAGSPGKFTQALKEAGVTVFHVVPSLEGALKAIDAGVDGLVVEGGEGGGFKSPNPVSSMVLLPLIRSQTDVPIVAAGGITDGASMAAAFALGAEGVQMGTRMVSSAESPVHNNWKNAIVAANETDTVFLNQQAKPCFRALRTERTAKLLPMGSFDPTEHMMNMQDLYFGGDMEAAIPLTGQVAGRIDEIKPVAQILEETMQEFHTIIASLSSQYSVSN